LKGRELEVKGKFDEGPLGGRNYEFGLPWGALGKNLRAGKKKRDVHDLVAAVLLLEESA